MRKTIDKKYSKIYNSKAFKIRIVGSNLSKVRTYDFALKMGARNLTIW